MRKTECFEVERHGAVAELRLARPDAFNTMTPAFWRELPELVQELDAEGGVRALVLTSTGRHFTAGMDLAVFQAPGGAGGGGAGGAPAEPGRQRAAMREQVLRFQETFNALERARMPVIAAVQGGCVGGGVDLVSACDFRHCSADAFFCIQEINIGLTADVGTLQRLPRLIPEGVVRELAYSGRRLPAARARELGLVNEVHADAASLRSAVLELAGEIAERSPLAVWGSKVMLNYTRDHSIADGLDYIATWQAGMFFGGDMQEAFVAKQEKRAAEFEGLPPLRKR